MWQMQCGGDKGVSCVLWLELVHYESLLMMGRKLFFGNSYILTKTR